jgi:hypothetical protein
MIHYFLIITYPGSGKQILMHTGEKAVASDEENKELLITMGERLLNENIIASYQLVMTAGTEVNRMTKAYAFRDLMDIEESMART